MTRKKTKSIPASSQAGLVTEQLLEPILRFLKQAGVSEEEAAAAFKKAWKRSSRLVDAENVALSRLGNTQPYVTMMGLWSRDARYLDRQGNPKVLPLKGRASFASLVRQADPKLSAVDALNVLKSFGNVALASRTAVRLTKPFFHIRSDQTLAFEPSVRFLLDAAGNVRQSLIGLPSNKAPSVPKDQHFWRSVDSISLPQKRTKEFLSLVKALSLTFLQDIDDWLAENSVGEESGTKATRVGVGMFTIGSHLE